MEGGYRTGQNHGDPHPEGPPPANERQGGGRHQETDLLVPGVAGHRGCMPIVLSGGSALRPDSATGVIAAGGAGEWGTHRRRGGCPLAPAAILSNLGGGGLQGPALRGVSATGRAGRLHRHRGGPHRPGKGQEPVPRPTAWAPPALVLPNGYTVGIDGLNPGGFAGGPTTCLRTGSSWSWTTSSTWSPRIRRKCPGAREPLPPPGIDEPYENSFNTTSPWWPTDRPPDQTAGAADAQIAKQRTLLLHPPGGTTMGDGDAVFAMATTTAVPAHAYPTRSSMCSNNAAA